MTDKEKLEKSYSLLMNKSDYEGAYYCIKLMYEMFKRDCIQYIKDFRQYISHVDG